MYLKTLKLRNFKSFAGSTEIPFNPGFTGVAGPNGMGKSNVADAILFCLGPRSSKALRAERLPELFFNGGASKKAATECEVSLVFDNRDRSFPVESDEVEVSRYVKAAPGDPDGYYSYFYVNHRRSTQTEIDYLLAHARLSGEASNVVQQGDVNRIVAMSPLERRGEVERLAGIAQYDEELSKAAEKTEALEANLNQIQTLLTEVTRHLTELEGQREGAKKFQDLTSRKRRHEAQLARVTLARAREEVASWQKRLDELREEETSLKADLQKESARQAELTSQASQLEADAARRGGEEALRLKGDIDQQSVDVGRAQMALEHLQEEIKDLQGEASALEKELSGRRKAIEGLKEDLGTHRAALAEVEKKIQADQKAMEGLHSLADASQGKAAQIRKGVLESQRNLSQTEQRWREELERTGKVRSAVETARHDVAASAEEVSNRQLEVKDLEFRLKDTRGSQKGSDRSSQDLNAELQKARANERQARARQEALQQELIQLNRAYAALDAAIKERSGQGGQASRLAAVDYLLKQRDLGKVPGIRGTVEELASYDPQYSTAVLVAAGVRFQALVVESDQVAESCIQLLRSEKKGVVTFLPLNKVLAGRPHGKSLLVQKAPGCRGFALDLVRFDEELRPAFWYVFGETLVFDALGPARAQMGGVRLVTLQGDLIEASGAITGGYLGNGERGRGPSPLVDLKRKGEEIRALTEEEGRVRSDLASLEEKIRTLTEELTKRSTLAASQGSTLEQLQKDLARAQEVFKGARTKWEAAQGELKTQEAELARAEGKTAQLEAERARLTKELERLNGEWVSALPQNAAPRLKELQAALAVLGQEQADLRGKVGSDESSLKGAVEVLAAKEQEHKDLLAKVLTRQKEEKKQSQSLAQAQQKLDALRAVLEKQSGAFRALDEKRRKVNEELQAVAQRVGALTGTLTSRGDQIHETEIKLSTCQTALEGLQGQAGEVSPEDDVELVKLTPEELRRRIRELDEAIEALGPVNAGALEAYDSEKTRADEFHAEVERLVAEREGLKALQKELEGKKQARLKEVVATVAQGFSEIYRELSGGGEGEIALESPQDPLAGGLLIRVRPLGKKVQRLEQLSGGEKSLASLAFIFSLQRYDPSPLYVLDEVDMSLDGVNAENIGRMFRRNASRAQFVVISLRKVTLKWAEHLIGVTMHGDGVSRVVGIRLDDIKDVDEKELKSVALSPSALAAQGRPEGPAAPGGPRPEVAMTSGPERGGSRP